MKKTLILLVVLIVLVCSVFATVPFFEGDIISPSDKGNITVLNDFVADQLDLTAINITLYNPTQHSLWNNDTKATNITFTNLTNTYSYNQLFLSNQSTPLEQNKAEINVTINPGNRTILLFQNEADDPKPSSIAGTITEYQTSYVEGTSLTVSCVGTGSHTITNLEDIGTYQVYHDGAFLEYSSSSTYTMTGCSTWEFIKSTSITDNTVIRNTSDNFILAIGVIAALYSVFAILIVVSIIMSVLKNRPVNWKAVILAVSALFLNAIFSVLLTYILIHLG